MKIKTIYIALAAMLTGLTTVLKIFRPVLSTLPFVALSFAYIPCFFAGVLFSKGTFIVGEKYRITNFFIGIFLAFTVGFMGDLLGWILHPLGAYNPLIAVATGLLAVIPCLIFRFMPFRWQIKLVTSFVTIGVIVTAGLNTYADWWYFSSHSKTFWAYLFARLPWQGLIVLINGVLCATMYIPVTKITAKYTEA